MPKYEFYKNNRTDKVWWVAELDEDNYPIKGRLLISFDKVKVYDLWTDYSQLDEKQKALFDKENPYWAEFLLGNHIEKEQ